MRLVQKPFEARVYDPEREYTMLDVEHTFPLMEDLEKDKKFKGITFADRTFELIDTYEAWTEVRVEMAGCHMIAADTETEGLGKLRHKIIGYCFSYVRPNKTHQRVLGNNLRNVYVPVRHRTGDRNIRPEVVASDLQPILEDPTKVWFWWNAKFDLHMLRNENLRPPKRVIDGQIYRRLFYPERLGSLKQTAQDEIDPNASKMASLMGVYVKAFCKRNKWRVPSRSSVGPSYYEYIPTPIMAAYGARDTFYTYEASVLYLDRVNNDAGLKRLASVEHLFMDVLFEMECFGLYVDTDQVQVNIEHATQMMQEIEDSIEANIGEPCPALGSTKQVAALFKKLRVPTIKATAKTADLPRDQQVPSLGAEVLLRLGKMGHEIATEVQAWRSARDIRSKYLDGMTNMLECDQRIHASYKQIGAATGRISSSGPNMQNFPSRGKLAPLVKECLVMPPELRGDYVWVFADLSQIELRILAHVTGDPGMRDAYEQGRDLHSETAKAMFTSRWEASDDKQRKVLRAASKAIGFGLVYGMGPQGLSMYLYNQGVERSSQQCKHDLEAYFAARPLVPKWIDRTKRFLRRAGYVSNLFGRRRNFPRILVRDIPFKHIAAMEREGVNFMIQGAAADHYKLGCVHMHSAFKQAGLRVHLQNTIHDEIQYHVHRDDLLRSVEIVKWAFCQKAAEWSSIPIVMDFEYSMMRWSDKKDLTVKDLREISQKTATGDDRRVLDVDTWA